ncbi:iron complex transport system ATP-binding protein [Steroidobacter denitrificans]|uniref:Iron complex transport system ATP-binding protein n=1 Tax=Steroidobacter denitrificans TaxID=465721 RepID=A0A127FE35_STEDE|nr:ABC transporter ATP-binding protein [Steroidobacter denitrificans]AMN47988.1 iron complex transport system ATP-binding protein [Steroidobacter denitrificans]
MSAAAAIEARALSIGYRNHCVGTDISFAVAAGEVLCLLGPNGSGKTTLFKTLLGLLAPLAGEVRVLDEPVCGWPRAAFARHVGYVPQAHAGLFAFTAEDIVLMARTARLGRFAVPSRHDRQIAADCLAALGIGHLRQRIYTRISGGERQLVLIARALAQQPVLLVMDEPTASLDFGNQIRVLEHINHLRTQGIGVLMSTHQPEHALRVADRIALLAPGGLVGIGAPVAIATPANLAALYGVTEDAVAAAFAFPNGIPAPTALLSNAAHHRAARRIS